MVAPGSDMPSAAAQLADLLRGRILAGEMPDGTLLPAEHRLAAEYGLGVDTVRRALVILRGEALIVTERPYGSRVRRPERRRISVLRGSTMARVWMPSPEERRVYGVPEGVPLMEIILPSGQSQVHPADEVTFRIT